MVPSLIGLILTFIGTIITSIELVREREAGTLEQLAVTPLRPADVILGKIAPYFVLAAVDIVLVAPLMTVLFHVPFAGNPACWWRELPCSSWWLISTLSPDAGPGHAAASCCPD